MTPPAAICVGLAYAQASLQRRRRRCKSPSDVAQRVSYTTKVCAHAIKGVRVVHVCRAGAGMQQPPPNDDCKQYGEPGEHGPGRARDTHARVVHTVPPVCAEPMHPARISRLLPLRRQMRLLQACAQAAPRCQAADDPPTHCAAGVWLVETGTLGRAGTRRALERSD